MPTNLFARLNLDLLYPPFRAVVFEVAARARALGHDYVATHGFRSIEEQQRLFVAWGQGKGGRAAPGGRSAHNYGLAVDFCADADEAKPGLQPDWREPAYDVLGECAQALGLVWGNSFNDSPHVQWPGYVSGKELGALRRIALYAHADKDLEEVWAHLDAERATLAWQAANPVLHALLERLGFNEAPTAARMA